MRKEVVIWRLIDGKVGHQSQSEGLVTSLKKKVLCSCFDIKVKGKWRGVADYLSGVWSLGRGLPLPDLIIGAGHTTHFHMLAARKSYGGKAIVLMKPSLPTHLFDLSLIPKHDNYQGGGNFIETKGVLNAIQAGGVHSDNHALVMIGGPSKHYVWNEDKMVSQLLALIGEQPKKQYTLTTSPRTPKPLLDRLAKIDFADNVTVTPFQETNETWVAEQLSQCSDTWVTEDSASMLYEALTANVSVGLLSMQRRRESRVSAGVDDLLSSGLVVRLEDFLTDDGVMAKQSFHLAEANRCADWVVDEWVMPITDEDLEPAFI